jgi:hypothetical protein
MQRDLDIKLVIDILSITRQRDGIERALELAATMVIVASSIVSREHGQAYAVRLLDAAATILPRQRVGSG